MPLVRRTRAIFRRAEFGFFGVVVETRVQTPRFCGAPASAGVLVFAGLDLRPLRISWLTVGMLRLSFSFWSYADRRPAEPDGSRQTGRAWYRIAEGSAKRIHGFRPFGAAVSSPFGDGRPPGASLQ